MLRFRDVCYKDHPLSFTLIPFFLCELPTVLLAPNLRCKLSELGVELRGPAILFCAGPLVAHSDGFSPLKGIEEVGRTLRGCRNCFADRVEVGQERGFGTGKGNDRLFGLAELLGEALLCVFDGGGSKGEGLGKAREPLEALNEGWEGSKGVLDLGIAENG